MTGRTVWWAIPLVVIAVFLFALPTLAQSQQTTVTGAGSGVYPAGTTIKSSSLSALKGVTLTSLTFGMGVALPGDGTANGTFESTLIGTSAKGLPRNIVVEGNATSGSGQAGGPANYAGTCTVNPGDGTAPLTGVPFTVVVAKLPNGSWGLTLTLSTTGLPAATITSGSVTIK
jgi:hypothetical protein